jgi:hypothetical protein
MTHLPVLSGGRGSNPDKDKRSFFSTKVQSRSAAQPSSCSLGTGDISRAKCGQVVKWTSYLHQVRRLGMSGAVPLLPPICLQGLDRDNFTVTECPFCWVSEHGSCLWMSRRMQVFCAVNYKVLKFSVLLDVMYILVNRYKWNGVTSRKTVIRTINVSDHLIWQYAFWSQVENI